MAVKFANFLQISNEVQKVLNSNNDLDFLSFISNINWNFINNSSDEDIDKFILEFSELLTHFSQNSNITPRLCEVVMKYLYVLPNPEKFIKSYKPFIFLIWNLYFTNPYLKSALQNSIKHIFPHYMGATFESVTGYVKNLLDLISINYSSTSTALLKYNEYGKLFVKEMREFILQEIVNYIIPLDSHLVLKDLQLPESERPKEVINQLAKMDKIMSLLFNFINQNCFNAEGQQDESQMKDLFKKIKSIYLKTILIYDMQNSLFHIHFLLAYMTSFQQSFSRNICEYLWTIATDKNQTSVKQCAAIRSLSGYVVKFNFFEIEYIISILSEMFLWCNAYLNETETINGNDEKHNIFYCIANGGLYILLHRHKEIIEHFKSISNFSAYSDFWQLSYLTMHKCNVLKEFPYRDQLPKLCELFRNCYLGFIDTIVEEQVIRKGKPKLLVGMPFRFYFLKDSIESLVKYRVSTVKHTYLN